MVASGAMFRVVGLLLAVFLVNCAVREPLDTVAETYIDLAFALNRLDAVRPEIASRPLETIEEETAQLLGELDAMPESLRREFLEGQLRALAARARILRGEDMTFEDEARALYGATFPVRDERESEPILARLDELLDGDDALVARLTAYQQQFLVDDLEASVRASLDECRRRTRAHIELPQGESVDVEYVRAVPWASYHEYRGSLRSVVQINRDVSWTSRDLLEAVCHESYPGHHTLSVLTDVELVQQRGLPEYSVRTLHSPYGLLLERLASAGVRLALGDDGLSEVERLAFCLRPLAAEGARRYLEGRRDRVATVIWLEKHALMADAWTFLRFVDRYRGYVMGYAYDEELSWERFSKLAKGAHEAW